MKYILYQIPDTDPKPPSGVKQFGVCDKYNTGMIPDDFLHLLDIEPYKVTFITEGTARAYLWYSNTGASYKVKEEETLSLPNAQIVFKTKDRVYATEEEIKNSILLTKEIKKKKYKLRFDKKFLELKSAYSELEWEHNNSDKYKLTKDLYDELQENLKAIDAATTMNELVMFDPMRELHDSVLDDEGMHGEG